MSKIDRKRGCAIRKHRKGFRVVMYYDDPGAYFDETGVPATVELAKEAGFDTDKYAAERVKHLKRKKFENDLAAGLADDEAGLAVVNKGKLEVVAGQKPGTFRIVDGNGKAVTKTPMTAEEVAVTFKALTGKKWTPPAEGDGKNAGGKKEEPKDPPPADDLTGDPDDLT